MLFFKPKAQRLMAAYEKALDGGGFSPERLGEVNDLDEKLKKLGSEHPEEFVGLLTEDNAGVIGDWVAGSGTKGVEILRGVIVGADLERARMALRVLWEFEESAASEVDLLRELLGHRDEKMRQRAAHCLGRIGNLAVSAGPKLARLAREGSDEEKRSAFFALERTWYEPRMVAQICYDAIALGSQEIRGVAMDTLKEIGGDPNPALDGILAAVESAEEASVASAGVQLLGKCDLSGEGIRARAVGALERLARRRMDTKCLRSLWALNPGNAVVMQKVEEGLRSDDSDMEAACDVICGMKEAGARFVPLLMERLEKAGEYWDFCWAAVDALGEIGPGALGAKGTLEKMLAHESELVRTRAKEALRKIVGAG